MRVREAPEGNEVAARGQGQEPWAGGVAGGNGEEDGVRRP